MNSVSLQLDLQRINKTPRNSGVGIGVDRANPSDGIADRSLQALVRGIRKDARRDAMKYLLRSDTGHDGE